MDDVIKTKDPIPFPNDEMKEKMSNFNYEIKSSVERSFSPGYIKHILENGPLFEPPIYLTKGFDSNEKIPIPQSQDVKFYGIWAGWQLRLEYKFFDTEFLFFDNSCGIIPFWACLISPIPKKIHIKQHRSFHIPSTSAAYLLKARKLRIRIHWDENGIFDEDYTLKNIFYKDLKDFMGIEWTIDPNDVSKLKSIGENGAYIYVRFNDKTLEPVLINPSQVYEYCNYKRWSIFLLNHKIVKPPKI